MDGFLPTWRKVFNGDEFDLFLQSGNFLGVGTIRVVIYRNHIAIIDYRLLIAVLPCSAFRIPHSLFHQSLLTPRLYHALPLFPRPTRALGIGRTRSSTPVFLAFVAWGNR